MPAKSPRLPKLCSHRGTNRAFVRINGRQVYLGKLHSPESHERYGLVCSDILAGRDPLERLQPKSKTAAGESAGLTVADLAKLHGDFAKQSYRHPDGTPTGEHGNITAAWKDAVAVCGPTPVDQFTPQLLRSVRDRLAGRGLARTTINARIGKLVGGFAWGVERELVAPEAYAALRGLPPLKAGRRSSLAREPEPVRPVNEADYQATLPHLPATVRDMLEVQLLTGMRPGEVRRMKAGEIDRSGDAWLYTPAIHKTSHRKQDRQIFIGPRAQQILRPYLDRPDDMHVFRPIDAERKRREAAHANRKTPPGQGNSPGTSRVKSPLRSPGEFYSKDAVNHAIARACIKAGVDKWSPNQLRHTAATSIRQRFGMDAAQTTLGHSNSATTERYALADRSAAEAVAIEIG